MRRSGPRPRADGRVRRRGSPAVRLPAALRPPRARPRGRAPGERRPFPRHRALDPIAEPVAQPGTPPRAPTCCQAPPCRTTWTTLPREPGALVEAALGRPRLGHAGDGLEDGAARRRASDGQHEQHPLPQLGAVEPPHLGRHPHRPRRLSRGPGHHEPDRRRLTDPGREAALGERVETKRAPPQAGRRKDEREGGSPRTPPRAAPTRRLIQREGDERDVARTRPRWRARAPRTPSPRAASVDGARALARARERPSRAVPRLVREEGVGNREVPHAFQKKGARGGNMVSPADAGVAERPSRPSGS